MNRSVASAQNNPRSRHRAAILRTISITGVAVVCAALALGCSSEKPEATGGSKRTDVTTSTKLVAPDDVEPMPSTGCRSDESPPELGSNEKLALSVAGNERWYLQHVPTSYTPAKPLPLIIDLHGYSEGAEVHAALSALTDSGESAGFITLTPQGQGNPAHWDTTSGSPDIKFVGALMDTTEEDMCVDLARVYLTGLSNGAFLSSAAACAYSDRVAAIAPVAGLRKVGDCKLERPVPVITFHGDADNFVSFEGGYGPGVSSLPLPDGSGRTIGDATEERASESSDTEQVVDPAGEDLSIPEILAWWAKIDGCKATTKKTSIADDVVLVSHPCPPGVNVELYRVLGGGHSWPGSVFSTAIESVVGKTTMSIDANALMWQFFLAHPLR